MQRILLVEDNDMNRDLISRKLVRRGFEVSLASDGAAGVEATVRERPDLVLMDIGLPVLDGYEATRLIKENPEVRHIPVVGLSAHAMSGDSEKAMAAGCDDYDTKPIEWPRLLGKIQSLLERAASRAEESGEVGHTETAPASAERHILLVHESPLHREMLAGRLAGRDFGLVTASSAREALDRLGERAWDALIVDIGLGEVEGQLGIEVLRSHPRGQEPPLLLLAPVDRAQDAASLLGAGADEMILQPFRPEELLHRLNRLLAPGGSTAEEGTGRAESRVELACERRRTEHLVRALIPTQWVERLRQEHRLPPQQLDNVTVLCLD
ncbi:MAG: response regulator, partial [Holophagales bacterium]|nr:response regulator [Holophagales bacterium]